MTHRTTSGDRGVVKCCLPRLRGHTGRPLRRRSAIRPSLASGRLDPSPGGSRLGAPNGDRFAMPCPLRLNGLFPGDGGPRPLRQINGDLREINSPGTSYTPLSKYESYADVQAGPQVGAPLTCPPPGTALHVEVVRVAVISTVPSDVRGRLARPRAGWNPVSERNPRRGRRFWTWGSHWGGGGTEARAGTLRLGRRMLRCIDGRRGVSLQSAPLAANHRTARSRRPRANSKDLQSYGGCNAPSCVIA